MSTTIKLGKAYVLKVPFHYTKEPSEWGILNFLTLGKFREPLIFVDEILGVSVADMGAGHYNTSVRPKTSATVH
jgi:hypothetical protein